MKLKKLTALLLGVTMTVTMLAGCGGAAKTDDSSTSSTTETTTESSDTAGDSTTEEAKTSYSEDEISDFTMFITMPGSEINDDNEIAQMIGEKWGVRIKETWLTGQTASEATGLLESFFSPTGRNRPHPRGGAESGERYSNPPQASWRLQTLKCISIHL